MRVPNWLRGPVAAASLLLVATACDEEGEATTQSSVVLFGDSIFYDNMNTVKPGWLQVGYVPFDLSMPGWGLDIASWEDPDFATLRLEWEERVSTALATQVNPHRGRELRNQRLQRKQPQHDGL